MKRRIKIIVALFLVLNGNIFSQPKLPHLLTTESLKSNGLQVSKAASSGPVTVVNLAGGLPNSPSYNLNQLILPDYYTRHFGFFCQKEFQFEKNTKIPLRFRLGSLAYCNMLEGK